MERSLLHKYPVPEISLYMIILYPVALGDGTAILINNFISNKRSHTFSESWLIWETGNVPLTWVNMSLLSYSYTADYKWVLNSNRKCRDERVTHQHVSTMEAGCVGNLCHGRISNTLQNWLHCTRVLIRCLIMMITHTTLPTFPAHTHKRWPKLSQIYLVIINKSTLW